MCMCELSASYKMLDKKSNVQITEISLNLKCVFHFARQEIPLNLKCVYACVRVCVRVCACLRVCLYEYVCVCVFDNTEGIPDPYPPLPPPRGGTRRGQRCSHVIYTSGTSGQPKGVVCEHAGLVAYMHAKACAHSIMPYPREAAHCNTLQHAATHSNSPLQATTHCNTPQHNTTHCTALQHTATHCTTLQHTAPHHTTWEPAGHVGAGSGEGGGGGGPKGPSRVLMTAAATWDPSLGDIFSTLGTGAVLCLAPRAALLSHLLVRCVLVYVYLSVNIYVNMYIYICIYL